MKTCRNVLFTFAVLVLFASPVFARDITFAWDANPEPDVVGYRVYYKSGSSTLPFNGTGADQGDSPVDVGNTLTATLTGLPDGEIFYFAVTAYNADGLESPYSNVVASDWTPALLSPADGEQIAAAAVDLAWSPAPAGTQVVYTLHYGTDPALQGASLASHTDETPAAFAGAALLGIFGVALFRRRLAPVVALALLGSLLVAGCGGGGGGGSDDPAAEPVPVISPDGNSGPAPADGTATVSGINGTTHTLRDLQPGTTYYWKVVAVDAKGNERESAVGTFQTGR